MPRSRALWPVLAAALVPVHLSGQPMRVYAAVMIVVTCFGAVLHVARAVRSHGRARRVWSLTAVAFACWAVAQLWGGLPRVISGAAPERGWLIGVLTLTAFLCAVAAMLIVPAAPRTSGGRLRMALDALVAASSLFGITWVIVLGPLQRSAESDGALLDVTYPSLAAAVLSIAVVLLAGQSRRRAGAVRAITGGVLLISLSTLVAMAARIGDAEWLRPWVLDGYIAAALVLAVAPRFALPRSGDRVWHPPTATLGLLPYLPMIGYGAVCVVPTLAGRRLDVEALWAGVVMIAALLARQFVTIRSNVALTRDLSAERGRFAHEAAHDALTGLPNRARLNHLIAGAGDDTVLLMIDLDGFKAVNDTLGHTAGDQLLVVIADRLRAAIAPFGGAAVGARLGGDEFAVLLRDGGLQRACDLARTLLDRCAEPVRLDGRTASVRASIGIAGHTADRSAAALMQEADLALYDAKHRGKGQFRLFDQELSASVADQRRLEAELGGALAAGQLELVYQRVVDLADSSAIGVEASVRWRHPRLGLLEPDEFLPAAADAGLLPEIDRWVIDTAVARLAAWTAADPGFRLSIHLSDRYLSAGSVVGDLGRTLARHELPGSALVVRLHDAGTLDELEPVLRDLRVLGVRISLERFGVGHSAIAELADLQVDLIKLHPAFLAGLDRGPEAANLLGALIAMAESVGIGCLAGGVSQPDQVARLRALGCRRATGPLFGLPVPASAVTVRDRIQYVS